MEEKEERFQEDFFSLTQAALLVLTQSAVTPYMAEWNRRFVLASRGAG
jgi:hypothetical protein